MQAIKKPLQWSAENYHQSFKGLLNHK